METSTFGFEIGATRIAIELVEGVCYKLRMMGIKLEALAILLCDNESTVKNTSRPESLIKRSATRLPITRQERQHQLVRFELSKRTLQQMLQIS